MGLVLQGNPAVPCGSFQNVTKVMISCLRAHYPPHTDWQLIRCESKSVPVSHRGHSLPYSPELKVRLKHSVKSDIFWNRHAIYFVLIKHLWYNQFLHKDFLAHIRSNASSNLIQTYNGKIPSEGPSSYISQLWFGSEVREENVFWWFFFFFTKWI